MVCTFRNAYYTYLKTNIISLIVKTVKKIIAQDLQIMYIHTQELEKARKKCMYMIIIKLFSKLPNNVKEWKSKNVVLNSY